MKMIEFTPEGHGAVGDGITDDGPAIQKVIDHLAANNGGVVRFSRKTYAIGPEGLKLRSRVELRGAGDDSVLLAQETETHSWLVSAYFASHAVIADLKLDGNERNRQVNEVVHGGISLDGCQHCRIENCTLTHFGRKIVPPQGSLGEAILLRVKENYRQDSVGNRIINNRIMDPGGNVSFAIRIWSDWRENLPDDGFLRLNKDNVVEGNFIEGTRWNAIEIAGPATRSNSVSRNVVKNTFGHRGVEADKGASGNTFVGNLVDGIHPDAGGAPYAAFCDQGVPALKGKHPERLAQDNTWIDNHAKNGVQDSLKRPLIGFFCNGSKGILIKGLSVENFSSNPAPPHTCAGIKAQGVLEEARIEECAARGVPVGIVFDNGHPQDNIHVSRCEFRATYRALWLAQPEPGLEKGMITLADNTVHCDPHQGQYAVLINAFKTVIMTGNTISGKRLVLGTSFKGEAFLEGKIFGQHQ